METNSVVFFNQINYPELPVKPIIAAWQIKNPENIGNLIRIADNLGADKVYILGDKFQIRTASVKKTAGLSFNNVSLIFTSPAEFFENLEEDYQLVAIETSSKSENIFATHLPQKIVWILGNESNGLPGEILKLCQMIVHIPMTGKCKSMNVSHALAVAAFEWQRQILFRPAIST